MTKPLSTAGAVRASAAGILLVSGCCNLAINASARSSRSMRSWSLSADTIIASNSRSISAALSSGVSSVTSDNLLRASVAIFAIVSRKVLISAIVGLHLRDRTQSLRSSPRACPRRRKGINSGNPPLFLQAILHPHSARCLRFSL